MSKEKSLFKIRGYIQAGSRRKEYIEDIFKEADRYVHAYTERQAMKIFAKRFAKILKYEPYAIYIGESVLIKVKEEQILKN